MAKGERGGKHRGGIGGRPQPVSNEDLSTNTKNLRELADFFARNYGGSMDEQSLSGTDFKVLWSQIEGIEETYRAFPELRPLLRSDRGMDLINNGNRTQPTHWIEIMAGGNDGKAYATMNGFGQLRIGPALQRHKDLVSLMGAYERDVASYYHPQGTNASHLSSHELGHLMVDLVKSAEGGGIWGNHWGLDTAESIVNNAWNSRGMKTARKQFKTDRGTELTIDAARHFISRYSDRNYHETVAEAVAEYSALGNNAQPFTRAIVKELKTRMRRATKTNNQIQ